VAELSLGAVGVEESLDGVLTSLSPLMKGKLLRLAAVANRLELGGDFVESFVPADSFPLAFAPLADTLERKEKSFRVVKMIEAGMPARAEMPSAVGVVRIAFDFDQPVVLHVADDSADRDTELAHARHLGDVFVLVAVGPVSFGLWAGQPTDAWHLAELAKFVGLAPNAFPLLHVDAQRLGLGFARTCITRGGFTGNGVLVGRIIAASR